MKLLVLYLHVPFDFKVYLDLLSLLQVEIITLHCNTVHNHLTILLYCLLALEVVYAIYYDFLLLICLFLLEGLIQLLTKFC